MIITKQAEVMIHDCEEQASEVVENKLLRGTGEGEETVGEGQQGSATTIGRGEELAMSPGLSAVCGEGVHQRNGLILLPTREEEERKRTNRDAIVPSARVPHGDEGTVRGVAGVDHLMLLSKR
jgi:hypothetical protein